MLCGAWSGSNALTLNLNSLESKSKPLNRGRHSNALASGQPRAAGPISSRSKQPSFRRSSRMNVIAPYLENAAAKLEELATRGGFDEFLRGFNDGFPVTYLVGLSALLLTFMILRKSILRKRQNLPPAVPGFPLIGNLIQMTVERPHKMFTSWSEKFGPIYTIKTGETTQVIITSSELAKEALVTKYDSICNRSLGTNITILTRDKRMVAMYDYGDRYRLLKKTLMNNLLGQNPQKSLRREREHYMNKSLDALFEELKQLPGSTGVVNVREAINNVLFRLGMHQMFGRDVEKVFVPELKREVHRWELYKILIQEMMRGAVLIDWRDFFPSLRWIPNKSLEAELHGAEEMRSVVIKALIKQQRELLLDKAAPDSYCDLLIENESQFTEDEFMLAVWEPIIESADTTAVTSEWAIFELANQPELQQKLYEEIKQVTGDRIVSEEDLPNLPFLNAVVKETLRKHTPVPILPPRFVNEKVEIGGYTIPPGYQIIVNIHGIHHDKNHFKDPQVFDPSRFVTSENKYDLGINDMKLMPFGGGKRICAGITQVFYIVPLIIASLVQHFEWSLPAGGEVSADEETVYLTAQKLVPLTAVARPRVSSRLRKAGALAENKALN